LETNENNVEVPLFFSPEAYQKNQQAEWKVHEITVMHIE